MGSIKDFFICIASFTFLHHAHISTIGLGAPVADNGGGSAINANVFANFDDARKYLQQCGLPSRELFGDSYGPGIDHFSLGCAPFEPFKHPYAMCYMFAWKVDSICPMYRAEGQNDPDLQRKIEDKYLHYTQTKSTPETFCEDLLSGFALSTSAVEQMMISSTHIKPTDLNTCISGCSKNLLPICQGYAFMIAEAGPYLEGLPGNQKYPPFDDQDVAEHDPSQKTEAAAHVNGETGNVGIPELKNDGDGRRDMDDVKVREKGTEDSVNPMINNEARTENRVGDQGGNVHAYVKDTVVPLPDGGASTVDKSLANLSFEKDKMSIHSQVADPARQDQPPFPSDNQMNGFVAEGQGGPAEVPLRINVGPGYSRLAATGVKVQDTKPAIPFPRTDGDPKQPELNPELGKHFYKQDQIQAPVQPVLTENIPFPGQSTSNLKRPEVESPVRQVASLGDGQPEDQSNHQPDDEHRVDQPDLLQASQSAIGGDQPNPAEMPLAQVQDDIHGEGPEEDVNDTPQDDEEDLPGISVSSDDDDQPADQEGFDDEEDDDEEFGVAQPPDAQNQQQVQQHPENANVILLDDEDDESSHFLAYSLTAIILILATYIMYHNKQKIIAIVVEGRNGKGKRRRGGKFYQKLDQNISEAMPSLQDQQA